MDEFPETISVENKDIFDKYLYYMTLKNIRRDIFEFMISRKDEDKYLKPLIQWSCKYAKKVAT